MFVILTLAPYGWWCRLLDVVSASWTRVMLEMYLPTCSMCLCTRIKRVNAPCISLYACIHLLIELVCMGSGIKDKVKTETDPVTETDYACEAYVMKTGMRAFHILHPIFRILFQGNVFSVQVILVPCRSCWCHAIARHGWIMSCSHACMR
jgi:hypothetical protein